MAIRNQRHPNVSEKRYKLALTLVRQDHVTCLCFSPGIDEHLRRCNENVNI